MNQLFGLQHRGDRYLSMTAAMTQAPVPTATSLCKHTAWMDRTLKIVGSRNLR